MSTTRREWLAATASLAGAAMMGPALRQLSAQPQSQPTLPRIGMCDWSLGKRTPAAFELAKKIGLGGVQVSLGTAANHMWLRQREVQEQYVQAARQNGLAIASVALGELNLVPLMSEPRAAIWVADAIEVARKLKVDNLLLAFFSKGELKAANKEDMRRVIEVLTELAPRAEAAGVALGVESYLSAEDHLRILDATKSKAVKVYFDLKNMADAGYDPVASMREIGADRICQIHFKDTPWLEHGSGKVNWPQAVAAIKEMNYRGWIVLETPSPTGNLVADTKKNLEYVRRLFVS